MDLDNLTYPDGYAKPAKSQVDIFKTWIWHSREICNNCFTKVRNIGAEIEVSGSVHTHRINGYYERTQDGIQDHTPFEDPSDRYGQTFCKNCGSDLGSLGYTKGTKEIAQDANKIVEYINNPKNDVPYTIDNAKRIAQTIKDLHSIPDNTGYSTEVLAVAIIDVIEPDPKT